MKPSASDHRSSFAFRAGVVLLLCIALGVGLGEWLWWKGDVPQAAVVAVSGPGAPGGAKPRPVLPATQATPSTAAPLTQAPETPPSAGPVPQDFAAWALEEPKKPRLEPLAAFDDWLQRWQRAAPAAKAALTPEGVALATARRPEFKALIVVDPREALLRSVPRVVMQDLPQSIVAQLEKPVSSTGTYDVYLGKTAPGLPEPKQPLAARYFEPEPGVSYKARVFGDLLPLMSQKQIPLQGVAIDREFAVAQSAVRPLEIGERIPAGAKVENLCPVSGKTTPAVASGAAVTNDTPTVQIGKRLITLCHASHVSVLEDNFRTYVQASGTGGAGFFFDNFPGTSSRSIGNLRCLYIRVTYQEQIAAPNTEDTAYNDMHNNARFYIESSYGKMTQTTTFTPLVMLPHTQKWYIDKDIEVNGLGLVHSDARAGALQLGYDQAQFDCIIVRVNGGPRLSGASWGGGPSVWVTWDGMDVLNHEVGHSLGLNHANFWSTTDGTAYGTGANQEYGNIFDVMGGGYGFAAGYNNVSRRLLGWLPANTFHTVTTNGVYRIYAYDQPRLEEGKRYAMTVAKDSVRQYNLEYHNAAGGSLSESALVIYSGMGSNAGHLLDTTPNSVSGKNDAGIAVGHTFSDLEADMHFTVLSKNATSPPSLDIAYNRGPFPGNVAPVASLAASATTINAGDSVTFTATASDANGDALAYAWQFSDGVNGTSTPTYTRTFTSAGTVNAMLTVSDMKGGTARASVVINVGTSTVQTVTGTITANSAPLAGVYVSNGTQWTYSNTDGTYSLTGLSTGAQTLTASLAGYTFSAGFTNPLTVVTGTNTANWTATAPVFVTLTKISDATEGGANGTFRLTRTGDTSAALTVLVSPAGGTATKTTDYTFTPDYVASGSFESFTIPGGSATLDIVVAAVDDAIAEGPETITLQLASATGYLSGAANAVVMTINDNDTALPMVSVTAPDPYATEGPGSTDTGTFRFSRTGATTAALNVTVAWSGAATNGTDYTTLPSTITIPSGQSSVDVVVAPIDDNLIEGPEDVVATLGTSAAYVRDSSATTATVIITDDDVPVVTVSVPDPYASEAGPRSGTVLFTRTGSTATALTVYYGITGTASYGTDYQALPGQVTIPAGASSAPVVVMPYDDDIGELTETVILTLATFNDAYSVGSPNQGTVYIADNNDAPQVSVRAGTVGVEGGANATVIFHSIGTGSGNVTVNYTVGGTATPGVDYTALSGSVVIPVKGSNDPTVTSPVIDDAIAEPTETVVITITDGPGYKVYNDRSAVALIQDNDSGGERVIVSTYNQSPSEAGPTNGTFYFSRAGTTGALTVNYAISGTATNGVDYVALSGTCVIPDTQYGVNVTLTPIDDNLVEGVETVTLTVLPGIGYGPGFPASATYEIADNDTPTVTVGFQSLTLVTTEQPGPLGEYRDLPVVLSTASSNTITARVVSGGGTAMGDDVDWAFVDAANGNAIVPSATLTFAPGVTSQNLRIRVKNDGIVEPCEFAVLQIVSVANAGITAGRGTATVAIFDSVAGNLVTEERWNTGTVYTNNTWNSVTADYTSLLSSFTPAQNVADNYSRRLTGQITAPVSGAYTFWIASDDASRLYLSTDTSAANKSQIATVSSYTSFQAWDTFASQKSASINLIAGQSYYMEVQHQEVGGGDHVSVAWQGPNFTRTPVTMTLPDTAPRTVRMLLPATQRSELDGSEPWLMAVLDRPAGSTAITVDYSITGGTATNGSDYILAPGTLTFATGEQFKMIPLSIINDAIGEGPETIVISLSNPVGAALTAPSSHTITLIDGSAPVVPTQWASASSNQPAGTVIATASATFSTGRTAGNWSIIAGNAGNAFAIDGTGQITLTLPSQLPNPGGAQLILKVTDNLGAEGQGAINIVCNPGAGAVTEQRWTGAIPYNTSTWTTPPVYSGTLSTMTAAVNVADNYSRRMLGYLQPQVSGDYTFWVASDDQSRLYLSTDGYEANKVQIATVSSWTNFQAWDQSASQMSGTITLQAGQVYWIEVQHVELGGGDHASVAWSGPGIARMPIPASVMFPCAAGITFAPPAILLGTPAIVLTSPAANSSYSAGSSIALSASVTANGQTVTSVDFYRSGTLIGSSATAPYSIIYSNAANNLTEVLTAHVNFGTTFVTSPGVPVRVWSNDPAIDTDADGFTTGLELSLGTDPYNAASAPSPLFSGLRAWWKLDDGSGTVAADATGLGQNGTVSGAVSWTTGQVGGALNFDGSTTGILMGTAPALIGTTDFTLGAWIKVPVGTAAPGMIIQQSDPTGFEGEYMFSMNSDGTLNFSIYNFGYQFNFNTSTTVNDGQWHYVAAVRSDTNGFIYIDGVQAGTATGTVKALASLGVAVGYDYRGNSKRFKGTLDEVRIYARALSSIEINTIFSNHAPAWTSTSISKPNAIAGIAYAGQSLAGLATDADAGNTLIYAKASGPSWLIVAGDGTLSGTPTGSDAGNGTFTIRVFDNNTAHADATLNITVITLSPFDTWRMQHFGSLSIPGSAAYADPDNDGMSNLLEYALGGDPQTPNNQIQPKLSTTGDNLSLTFTRNLASTDITLTVQVANAPNGPWIAIAQSVGGSPFSVVATGAKINETGTGGTRTVTVSDLYTLSSGALSRRFMRLHVTTP